MQKKKKLFSFNLKELSNVEIKYVLEGEKC